MMSRNWLKNLDHLLVWLFLPLAFMISALKSLFSTEDHRVLIVRPGGLGDLVLLSFAINVHGDLNDYVFIIESRSEIWARHLGLNYFLYEDPMTFFKIPTFKNVICSEQRYGLALVYSIAFTCIDRVLNLRCFHSNRLSWLGKAIVYNPTNEHEVDSFSNLIFGKSFKNPHAESFVKSNIEVLYFGGSLEKSRALSEETWLEILQQWRNDQNQLYIVTSPSERTAARAIFKNEHFFEGNFEETVFLLKESKRILTIDSGAVHICSYYGLQADVIFTSGQDKKWKPLSPGSQVFYLDLPCRPCTLYGQVPPCPHAFRCTRLTNSDYSSILVSKSV